MRAAGAILGSGGGGEVIYDDPTSSGAVAALAAGEWIHVRKSGQLPSAPSTYQTVLLLGDLAEETAWSLDGRWSAAFSSPPAFSGGTQVFRGSVARAAGANVSGNDMDATGTSGLISGQLINFLVETNTISIQLRITAAQAYTYNLDFWMCQRPGPV